MEIQQRLLIFVTRANWVLLMVTSTAAGLIASPKFAMGTLFGGLIVTINFHLLYRTLKKAFAPPRLSSHNVVLAKYYARFTLSGVIIFLLISNQIVSPVGLFVGLSVVVASITLAAIVELTKLIFKEAV
ncbi:MAG: ATP synthase subunit I [Desulfobacterales bacterium]